jgi:putative salt-induced outer membrane protein
LLLAAALPAAAADAPAKPWKGTAEFSFVSATGNSKAQTTSAKGGFAYQFTPAASLEMEGGGLGSRSNGLVTAEQYYAGEKIARKVDDRDYVFEKYRWDRNRFSGVAHRHDFSIGAGRELIKTPADLLIAEGGPGYVNEERLREKRKTYASGRLYSKYTRELGAGSRFSQDAEWVQSLADDRDALINTETTLSAALSSSLALKNSFGWKHNSRPPAGARKDDTLVSVALVATF